VARRHATLASLTFPLGKKEGKCVASVLFWVSEARVACLLATGNGRQS